MAAKIGRTKPTRSLQPQDTKRKRNDRRPPDTSKELLKSGKKQRKIAPAPPQPTALQNLFGPPSYPWNANSCWLDSSLELIFIATMRNFNEFSSIFQAAPAGTALFQLHQTLNDRKLINVDEDDQSASLTIAQQRDDLRKALKEAGVIRTLTSTQPLMVCIQSFC